MWECQHCHQIFEEITNSGKANHSRWCDKNPKRDEYRTGNANAIQAMKKAREEKGFSNQFDKARALGLPVPVSPALGTSIPGTPHTTESKKKLSIARKKFLAENPDKHPWRSNNKFKSVPCEKFKEALIAAGISFVPEFQPLFPERFYAVDVAFPDRKICIEVNGNQHYNPDKTLKPYYQEKRDLILAAGWTIYEYHYSLMYDEEFVKKIVEKLKGDFNLGEVDYTFYIKVKAPPAICKNCPNEICDHNKSGYCGTCANLPELNIPSNRKLKFEVSKEELEKLVLENPLTIVGKMLGVTDNAIRRRCKKLGIKIPKFPTGHWIKGKASTNKLINITKEQIEELRKDKNNNWTAIGRLFNTSPGSIRKLAKKFDIPVGKASDKK